MLVDRFMKIKKLQANDKKIIIPDGSKVELWDFNVWSTSRPSRRFTIGADCQVNYLSLWSLFGKRTKQKRTIELGSRSRLNIQELILGGSDLNLEFVNKLAQDAQLDSQLLFFQRKREQLSVSSEFVFSGPGSKGRQIINGVADDGAQSDSRANLIIAKDAQQVDTRIDMKLYLLGEASRGLMRPELRISANDVFAGHSASTFKLDEKNLFYLRSRGLSSGQIKSLLVHSLFNSFLVSLPSARAGEEIKKSARSYLEMFN